MDKITVIPRWDNLRQDKSKSNVIKQYKYVQNFLVKQIFQKLQKLSIALPLTSKQ